MSGPLLSAVLVGEAAGADEPIVVDEGMVDVGFLDSVVPEVMVTGGTVGPVVELVTGGTTGGIDEVAVVVVPPAVVLGGVVTGVRDVVPCPGVVSPPDPGGATGMGKRPSRTPALALESSTSAARSSRVVRRCIFLCAFCFLLVAFGWYLIEVGGSEVSFGCLRVSLVSNKAAIKGK